jgi:hypothetical protein
MIHSAMNIAHVGRLIDCPIFVEVWDQGHLSVTGKLPCSSTFEYTTEVKETNDIHFEIEQAIWQKTGSKGL